jgi:hypothetical protein
MHAILKVTRQDDQEQIFLEPIGSVKQGYRELREAFPLNHEEVFQIGQHKFQYLSDQGV